jgi:hypothetical protein
MSLMAESGCLKQVDRGVDNPTSYHETRKGGQGPVWAVAPLIIIIMFINIVIIHPNTKSFDNLAS